MAERSLNAVLMKFFNLPPALRMILAVAGFGSLASIMFFLTRGFFQTRSGKIWILVILLGGAAVFGLVYLIVRLFRGRRSSQLSGALESQGPTRGDIAEQERLYREKFAGKLNDLRANGLSVYRLPWFVLMGEPGCGKTASLIHSGLDFPLGKDEVPGFGGTRNYNWWFTNDAVVLDTAGRIAFQEEGTTDRVEWEYFLTLMKRHRPRCPLNGVILALPADKLLRDSVEERAQKATVLRERLRQIHQALGVRFPTFVLVTKMDLVGGFSEFFEDVRVDLQQRNQMFGWSRPGEFEQAFDTAEFLPAFDDVHHRLRDWSMRYLQRKAADPELGLVVTFPEAFHELRGPLNDYISTVFQKSPLLEPPFFRGFYFTSAMQEGAPIFDVFTRAHPGLTLPERAVRAVDSKAFFIHDFYERKVFAEKGLVFRSAQHVTLNRRMRRLVWVGSAAMLVLMLALFGFGYFGVSDLVTQPQADCEQAVKSIGQARTGAPTYTRLAENLDLAERLQQHYEAYDRPWTGLRARSLYIGANIAQPRDAVRNIHARFVLETILRPVIQEAELQLGSVDELGRSPEQYLAALETYAGWYGELVGQPRGWLDQEQVGQRVTEVKALLTFLSTGDDTQQRALRQINAALKLPAGGRRQFARHVLDNTLGLEANAMTAVLTAAIQHLTDRWMPLTRLVPVPQDDFLRYWSDLAAHLGAVRTHYTEILALAGAFRQADEFDSAAERFMTLTEGVEYLGRATTPPKPGTLARAMFDLRAFLSEREVPQTEARRIRRFADQLAWMAGRWEAEFGRVRTALTAGSPSEQERPQRVVFEAVDEARRQLHARYQTSLQELRAQLQVPAELEPADFYEQTTRLLTLVEQRAALPTLDEQRAAIRLAEHPFGRYGELVTYLTELRGIVDAAGTGDFLDDLRRWPELLSTGGTALPTSQALRTWFEGAGAGRSPGEEAIRQWSGLAEHPFWRAADLYGLAESIWRGHQQRTVGTLLERMEARCAEVAGARDLPGLARLMPVFDQPSDALPFERHVSAAVVEKPREVLRQPEPVREKQEEDEDDWRQWRRQPAAAPAERAAEVTPTPSAPAPTEQPAERPPLVQYHTRALLHETAKAYGAVCATLGAHGQHGQRLRGALDTAANAYFDRYFLDWNAAYDDYLVLLDATTLGFLDKCRAGTLDWPAFQQELSRTGRDMTVEFASRLEALVREVVLYHEVFEDEGLYRHIEGRLQSLGVRNDLRSRLDDFGRAADQLMRRRIDPVSALSDSVAEAWQGYLRDIERTGADPKGAAAPPSRAALETALTEMIAWRRMQPADVRLFAPLLDLAAHGEVLLRHHLERELVRLAADRRGRYPLLADAHDQDPAGQRLARLAESALPVGALLAFLRSAARYRTDYGTLLTALRRGDADPYVTMLDHCAAWVQFLYGDQVGRLREEEPAPLRVKWAIARREGTTSAGNFYNRLTITLPLLSKTGYDPVGPVDEEARSGRLGSLPPNATEALADRDYDYRWSLVKRSGQDYLPPAVRVWDKNPQLAGPEQVRAAWQLPGTPSSLLRLVGADPANRLSGGEWVIPVMMKFGDETIGFDIAVRFERPFPGPIEPAPDPGPPPAMEAAQKYLSPAAGR
jgi:hypothetical protein